MIAIYNKEGVIIELLTVAEYLARSNELLALDAEMVAV